MFPRTARGRIVATGLLVLAVGIGPAEALRVPVRSYGPAEGLVDAGVNRVRVGPEGFVWVATRGGLWRFDGERFDVLGAQDGVPRTEVFDFTFAADGSLWIASEAGLFRGDPSKVLPEGPSFSEVRLGEGAGRELPHRVTASPDGVVWVGTFSGVWRITTNGGEIRAERRVPSSSDPALRIGRVQSLAVDPAGSLWIGTHVFGVYRLHPDGAVDHVGYEVNGANFVRDFLFDDRGGVWTAFIGGIARFDIGGFRAGARPSLILGPSDGLPGIDTQELLSVEAGRFQLASIGGITEIERDAKGVWNVGATLDRRSGLPADDVGSLVRDEEGNLWIGFKRRGLTKQIASRFLEQDDVEEPGTTIAALGRDHEGHLAVLSTAGSRSWTLRIIGPGRTEAHRLALPKEFFYVGWGVQQLLAQEPDGTWWVVSGNGALRYGASPDGMRRLERLPDTILDQQRGLPGSDIYLLFLDRNGDLWTSTSMHESASSVARVRRTGLVVETFSTDEVGSQHLAVGFLEDADGNLWIAFEDGALVRRRGGIFERIECPLRRLGNAPLLLDVRGRLWIVGDGIAVVDQVRDARPAARSYPLPAELADVSFTSGIDDGAGALYLGTPRGVVRLDPDSGRTRWFTAADGLVGGRIRLVARDRDGVLWFSDQSGLSRLTAGPDPVPTRHVPRIRSVRIAGMPVGIPALGATTLGPLTVAPAQRTVGIEFFAVHHGPGEPPRFQHRLEGAEVDWTDRGNERSVLYAGLAPGRYRFAVRTVEGDGSVASAPAVVEILVLAPVWRRGWFIGLVVAAAAALAYGVHRVRVARVLAVERVRTRIATDLHDEIGSSLAQISVLSQVAERDSAGTAGSSPRSLSRIGDLARSVVESMGETVWAISPREDSLSDLVRRMRRFALDLFADGDPSIRLELPPVERDERLDPEIRRTLYLVFKEALHNARKHASARLVEATLRRDRNGFELRVRDDGCGFDPAVTSRGHGHDGMRRRAEAIGGQLELRASPGAGSEVIFRVPMGATSLFRRIVGRGRGGT